MFSASVIARIVETAKRINVPPAALLAVTEVESGGRALWDVDGEMLPAIRFEGHYFHRRLKGKTLNMAVQAGLANPRAGRVRNPRSFSGRYAMLNRAMDIHRRAALESISMGLGQVMGAHWKSLGYASVEDMWAKAKSGIDGQVAIMAEFIKENRLDDELRALDWKAFARAYNGPGYRSNAYDTKMAQAFKRWSKRLNSGATGQSGAETGTLFIDQQRKLKALGFYKGKLDGLDGPKTKQAVKDFQRNHGLNPDGILGPLTDRELTRAYARVTKKSADKKIGGGIGTTGVGGAGKVIQDSVDALQPAAYDFTWLNWIILVLVLAGLAVAGWGLYQRITADEEITDEFDEVDFGDPLVEEGV